MVNGDDYAGDLLLSVCEYSTGERLFQRITLHGITLFERGDALLEDFSESEK